MSFFTDSNNNFNSGLSFETGDSEEKILSNTLEIIKQLTKKDAVWVCDPSIERGEYCIYNMQYTDYDSDESRFTNNPNGGFQINISNENKKTSIERAMSEILYGNDYDGAKDWALEESRKFKGEDWQKKAFDVNLEGHETLNKIRCQDAIGRQYIGTGERITSEDKKRAIDYELVDGADEKYNQILNPVEALKARSLGVDISESKFDNDTMDYYVNKAKGLSRKGLAKLSKSFYNKVVAPWLLANIKAIEEPPQPEPDNENEGNGDNGNQEPDNDSENTQDGESGDNESDENLGDSDETSDETSDNESDAGLEDDGDDIDEGNSMSQESIEAQEEMQSIENSCSNQTKNANEDFNDESESVMKDIPNLSGTGQSSEEGSLDWNELGEVEESDVEEGQEEFNKIEETIFDKDYDPNDADKVDYKRDIASKCHVRDTSRTRTPYPVNEMLARQLSKTFEKLMQSVGEDNAPAGSELDINAFMDSKTDRRPDVFIQEEDTTAWRGLIAIDTSGSMSGEKLEVCKSICATILEAVEHIPRVEVKIIGWSGSDYDCQIQEATTREELSSFQASSTTPMAKGMYYSKNQLEKMQGTRKVMFFLTDGYPNDNGDIAKVKQAVNEMRAKRYSVLGIGIGMNKEDCDRDGMFPDMFGKGFVACPTMSEVERILRKDFVKEVSKFLRC